MAQRSGFGEFIDTTTNDDHEAASKVATAQSANENVSSTVFMTNEPVSSENKPAAHHHTDSQSDSNQQKLPQTGNENTVLLGLGLSALAAMLGIGGRRLKKIKIITDWA